MGMKDVKEIPSGVKGIKSGFQSIVSGTKSLAKGLVAAYLIAIPVHDIWTGESLISKSWNSTAIPAADAMGLCSEGAMLDGSFICEPRGDGQGLETLIPKITIK